MNSMFGEKIRELREQQNLYLREVASLLGMDTAHLSKIEKGLRLFKRELIPSVANILKTDEDELLTLWLSDQIFEVIKDERLADQAIQLTEENLRFRKINGNND